MGCSVDIHAFVGVNALTPSAHFVTKAARHHQRSKLKKLSAAQPDASPACSLPSSFHFEICFDIPCFNMTYMKLQISNTTKGPE